MLIEEPGSFRDRSNRVYYLDGTVVRGVDAATLGHWRALRDQPFFRQLLDEGKVIGTEEAQSTAGGEWAGLLRHERVPFVSYPYEWTFGMLRSAALLYLEIIEQAISHGWTLKDGTAYNIQWIGSRPVFIDIPSFVPYEPGSPWIGYRQFCMMFLIPLMLKAYRDINYIPLLRSDLEGIEPAEAAKFFPLLSVAGRRGVFSHIYLHGKLQRAVSGRPPVNVRHSLAMVLGTIQSLARTVRSLRMPGRQTTWSGYECSHSYDQASFQEKMAFVERCLGRQRWPMVWDIGCNTGTFSLACSPHAASVVAIDGDFQAIETLFGRLGAGPANVLPLVMNLANPSPGQGWRGEERKALETRANPSLILCLALIHHMVISANIPLREYLSWLRRLGSAVIIEFVGPDDEMTQQLLRGRVNQYSDFTERNFEAAAAELFSIVEAAPLKGGQRKIYFLQPA